MSRSPRTAARQRSRSRRCRGKWVLECLWDHEVTQITPPLDSRAEAIIEYREFWSPSNVRIVRMQPHRQFDDEL